MVFLADENIEADLLIQLRRHLPDIDVIDVRDAGMAQTPDDVILQWAADNGRVVITHDVNTMRGLAEDRVRAGLPMPGVIVLLEHISYGAAIQAIIQYAVGPFVDLEGQIIFVQTPRRPLS